MSAARSNEVAPSTVLLLSRFPPPYGGLSIHSERLGATLERNGWRVQRVTPPEPPGPNARFRRGVVLWRQLRFLAGVLFARATVVHEHISTYSVGSARGADLFLTLALLLVLRMARAPWIVTSGKGLLPDSLAACSPRMRRTYRWLYSGAAGAIAKNVPILGAFEELGLSGRSHVVGTFLEPIALPGNHRLQTEAERFLAAHPISVVTAAFQFEPLYNLDAVVRAVHFVRSEGRDRGFGELGLIVLGSEVEGPEGFAAFTAAIEATGLAEHVLVLRDVDNALDVMARAAAFVRATDVDGDANSVKEAMLVGVPVLATDLPGRPPGIALIDPASLAELGSRLLEVLADREPSQLEANRAFVRADIERNCRGILAAYDRAR